MNNQELIELCKDIIQQLTNIRESIQKAFPAEYPLAGITREIEYYKQELIRLEGGASESS